VANDLIWIGVVLRAARSVKDERCTIRMLPVKEFAICIAKNFPKRTAAAGHARSLTALKWPPGSRRSFLTVRYAEH
jgi:hypothetical protein